MPKFFASNTFFIPITSFAVFLFYAINLSVPSGYSYGSGLLLLSSLVGLGSRPWLGLTIQDRSYIWIFAAIFGTSVAASIVHSNDLRDLDIASRFLLAIPIFWLLIKFPPRLSWLWAGVAMGGYSAAGIAIWQLYGLGWSDVDGLTNGVRFGAISTMLGILCVAGLLWARKEVVTDVWRWRLALGVGALSAWYGSLMSGTRGAWVALPVVFILFCLALFSKRNLYKGTALCAALLIAVSAWIAVTPENPVKTGYRNAVNDVGDYFERGIVTGSIGGRFAVWDAAVMNIPEKPLLGWGVKEYRQHLERQVSDGLLDPYVLQLSHTHNMYLEAAVYKGLVGLLTVLALLVFPFYYFGLRLRSPCMNVRIFAVSGTSLIAVFSILGLSHIGLYRNDILLFFLVSLMTLWACMRAEEYSL